MFLRATRVQAPPDKVQEAIQNFETNILKRVRSTPGNQGAILLINRQSGSGIGITYWESAKALAASEQMGIQTRAQSAKDLPGTQILNLDRAQFMMTDPPPRPKVLPLLRLVTPPTH